MVTSEQNTSETYKWS